MAALEGRFSNFHVFTKVLCCLSLLYAVQTCLLLTVVRLEDCNLVSFCIDDEMAKGPTLAEE